LLALGAGETNKKKKVFLSSNSPLPAMMLVVDALQAAMTVTVPFERSSRTAHLM
jgi:hypothetical protein